MRLLVVVGVLVLAFAAPAAAAPADRAAADKAYADLVGTTQVPSGWTGKVEGCVVGTEAPESIAATLTAVNILRDFAGLVPVTFDPIYNQKALAAALMMRAEGDLSHTPGEDWKCYSAEGAEGALRSNLILGGSGGDAMIGYVDDSGVASLGHRRLLLNPSARVMGTGSTGTTNALWTITPDDPAPPPVVVSWPPAGFVPWPLVFGDWYAGITEEVDLSAATVTVTLGGEPRTVSGIRELAPDYATKRGLAWKVALEPGDVDTDRRVEVSIAAADKTYAYGFDAFTPGPLPTPSPSPSPGGGEPTPEPDPDTGAPPTVRGAAKIVVTKLKFRRGKLKLALSIAGAADGTKVTVTVRRKKRSKAFTASLKGGTLKVSRKLGRKLGRAKKLKVRVAFPGDAGLEASALTRTVKRP